MIRSLPADRVHAWRMERQLLGHAKATDPAEVARRLIGVQAQVTSSAALAIALRSKTPRRSGTTAPVDATARALLDRSLVRSWAMRGTLHLFASDDVPLIEAALKGREMWRRPAWLRWFGLTEPEMEALIEVIGEILDDGIPRTRAELAVIVTERLGPEAGRHLLGSWGSVLKIASDRHYLVQSAESEAGVRFVRASRWIEGWRPHDGEGAVRDIVLRYLASYGPASVKEVLRWWGASIFRDVKGVFAELAGALAEVEVDGARAFVRTEDIAAIEATRPRRGTVHLVGGFDPLVVGAGLRRQLIPDAFLARVSRTAGWISPVVLLDGRAIAVWDSKVTGSTLTITVDPFEASAPALRGTIGDAAERISEAQGLRLEIAFGRVFDQPARKLAIRPEDA